MATVHPAKRRKTSPTTSVPVDAPSTPRNSRSASQDQSRTTPRRASYLSPTKSSLSRSHPNLLPRKPQSASAGPRQSKRVRVTTDLSSGLVGSPGKTPKTAPAKSFRPAQDETVQGTNGVVHSFSPTTPSRDAGDPRTTRSTEGNRLSASLRRPPRAPAAITRAKSPSVPPRTPIAQTEVDPTIAKDLQVNVDAQLLHETEGKLGTAPARNTRASTARASLESNSAVQVAENEDREEDREVERDKARGGYREMDQLSGISTIERGENFSKQRARRSRGVAEKIQQSPIRRKASKAIDRETEIEAKPGQREEDDEPEVGRRAEKRLSEMDLQNELVFEDEAEVEKWRLRDSLRATLQSLQSDVEKAEKAVASLQDVESQENTVHTDEILALLATNSALKPPPVASRPASFSLTSFLPFSARPRTKPSQDHLSDSPAPSHRPIDLADPLPYLQVFTPLTFTSTSTLVSASDSSESPSPLLIQKHDITATSPLSLLVARLELDVDTTSTVATRLALTSLSQWAEDELRPWISTHTKSSANITSVCWALGSYYTQAEQRARTWYRLSRQFSHLAGRDEDLNARRETPPEPSRRELLEHVGRTVWRIEKGNVALRFEWRITVDWTGEAESKVGVNVGLPNGWRKTDSRGVFQRVPEIFDGMVRSTGVEDAVRVLVQLLLLDDEAEQ
ncbi:MAG: hypothetical protein M1824_003564 [Vezdaea acicularis]|nr:MAG: hypothetical protein M1824_003564 [Vezdaea acicularis]